MYFWTLLLATATALYGVDEGRLLLMTQAESAFNRIEGSGTPQLRDATLCVQAQAALVPVTGPEDLSVVHFRKGYCRMAGATISRDPVEFTAAAGEFQRAIEAWAGRPVLKN